MQAEKTIETNTAKASLPAGFFLRSTSAFIEACLFMGLSLPVVFALPLFMKQAEFGVLAPLLPGIFFLEGLLPGFCFPVFVATFLATTYGPLGPVASSEVLAIGWTVVLGGLTIVNFLYHVFLESSSFQGTLGKIIVGVQVTNQQGERASILRVAVRNFARLLSMVLFMLGYFMLAKEKNGQSLHDKISGCLVLKQASEDAPNYYLSEKVEVSG